MKINLVVFAAVAGLLIAACAGSRASAPRGETQQPAAVVADEPACNPTPEPKPAPAPEPETPSHPGFVVTTGVHGNEPSGYLIKPDLEALGFTVYGPCNPWGIENNRRHLEDGRDLNRMFGRDDCPEAETIKQWLADNPPSFLLDLHEDPDGTAPYLIQHGPDDDIGRRIVDALKDEYEFDPEPQFMMVKGEDGLLNPDGKTLAMMAFMKIYGLGFYAWATYKCTAIVVECPGSWPEEKRKAYHLKVVQTAARLFEESND